MPHKLILDLDPGLDDALALAFVRSRNDFTLKAITTSFGRVGLPQATRNALRLAALLGIGADVTVCEGVATPLRKGEWLPDPHLHGRDGLGDWSGNEMTPVHDVDDRSAARAIVELALAEPGEITLLCSGPLSNLAQALRLEPRLPTLLKQVIVAGGGLDAPGDVSPAAEFNLWSDPHAADAVMGAGFALTLVGLNVSRAAPLPLAWFEEWAGPQPGPLKALLLHAAQHQSQVQAEEAGLPDLLEKRKGKLAADVNGERNSDHAPHPAIAIPGVLGLLWLVQPDLFRMASGPARVVPDGLAEGQLLLDRHEALNLPPYPQPGWPSAQRPVQVATHIDAAKALELAQRAYSSLS